MDSICGDFAPAAGRPSNVVAPISESDRFGSYSWC